MERVKNSSFVICSSWLTPIGSGRIYEQSSADRFYAELLLWKQHTKRMDVCMIDIHFSPNSGFSQVSDIIFRFIQKWLPVTDKCIGRRKAAVIRLVCRRCIGGYDPLRITPKIEFPPEMVASGVPDFSMIVFR